MALDDTRYSFYFSVLVEEGTGAFFGGNMQVGRRLVHGRGSSNELLPLEEVGGR